MVFAVESLQIILFYQIDEALCISGACGIARLFESACPPFIVCKAEVEEKSIAASCAQKFGMIFIAFGCLAIYTKFIVGAVVGHDHVRSSPCAAHFDAKVVVAFGGQTAHASGTLKQALR